MQTWKPGLCIVVGTSGVLLWLGWKAHFKMRGTGRGHGISSSDVLLEIVVVVIPSQSQGPYGTWAGDWQLKLLLHFLKIPSGTRQTKLCTVSCLLSAGNVELSTIRSLLSYVNCSSSTVSCVLSAVYYQLPSIICLLSAVYW